MKAWTTVSLLTLGIGLAAVFASSMMGPTAQFVDSAATGSGDVWFAPTDVVASGGNFTNGIHINTLGREPAAFTLEITYDESVVIPLEWSSDFPNVAANLSEPGVIRASGARIQGYGVSQDLELVTFRWATVSVGVTNLNLEVETIIDNYGGNIPTSPAPSRVAVVY